MFAAQSNELIVSYLQFRQTLFEFLQVYACTQNKGSRLVALHFWEKRTLFFRDSSAVRLGHTVAVGAVAYFYKEAHFQVAEGM